MKEKIDTPPPSENSEGGLSLPPNPKPRAKTGRKAGALYARPNLVGQKFNKLLVVAPSEDWVGKAGDRIARWECLCDCGNKKIVMVYHLKKGLIKSCGCHRDAMTKTRFTTHGHAVRDMGERNSTYGAWCAMKTRCSNPNQVGADRYVERGISVCDRWVNSYENFFADMGQHPGEGYSIDRINNDLGYSPENCRWATVKQQANNKSTNRFIEHKGERHTVMQWADILGINPQVIYQRLHRGIDPVLAITQPVKPSTKRKKESPCSPPPTPAP